MDTSQYIEEEVNDYKEKSYELLDYIKVMCFSYLIAKKPLHIFEKDLKDKLNEYQKYCNNSLILSQKEIDNIITQERKEYAIQSKLEPNKSILNELKFNLDTKSQIKANDRYYRIIKDFYKKTSKTLKKEYINETEYLSKKLTQYDKVEKVVPYHNQDGSVRAYFDIASYNSMVYNTNLTSTAWNSTIESAERMNNDLVYVPSHPFACPLCQEWQGKIYSLTGTNKNYPSIEIALQNGLKHPNCKHPILSYFGQKETSKYSNGEWVEKYEARQKKQALELQKERLNNDKKIFQKLGNQEEVDKINAKIKALNSSIKEQKQIMNG